jgi:hypothetical protein
MRQTREAVSEDEFVRRHNIFGKGGKMSGIIYVSQNTFRINLYNEK